MNLTDPTGEVTDGAGEPSLVDFMANAGVGLSYFSDQRTARRFENYEVNSFGVGA